MFISFILVPSTVEMIMEQAVLQGGVTLHSQIQLLLVISGFKALEFKQPKRSAQGFKVNHLVMS